MPPKFWSEKIPYIKKMKEFYSKINYNGINLWPVMANDVYTYYKNQEQRTRKEIFLEIMKNFLLIDRWEVRGKGNNIFATYFMARKDHNEFFLKSISKFRKDEISILDYYEQKVKNPLKRSNFTIPNPFLFFKILFGYRKQNIKKILTKNYWLFISKHYLRYKQIDKLNKIYKKISPKGYVAFCSSAFPEEAILTLLSKKDKIPTFSIQHGFYSPSKREYSPIAVQSENVVSDYYLVWGENSGRNIEEYLKDKSKIIIAGNPKYVLQKKKENPFSNRVITFFFSVPPYEKNNLEVVKILNKYAKKNPYIKIKLKIHPFDDIKNYVKFISEKNMEFVDREENVQKLLESSDIIITHHTTIELESLVYKKIILRFEDKGSLHFWKNKDDLFTDYNEFEEKINFLKYPKNLDKQIKFYKKEFNKNFYFEKNKTVPEVYREKIMQKCKIK